MRAHRGGGARRRAIDVRWGATPKAFTLLPGGHAGGNVWARNLDAVAGWVMSPGCPVLVGHPPVRLPPVLCPPAGRTHVLGSDRRARWQWRWNATSDGTRTGAPLPPGAYTITIGGATVSVAVT